MSYELSRFTYPSSDGKNTVAAYAFLPKGDVRAIVQLSHGMCDYVLRYLPLAEALTDAGYLFCGNDHLGHGSTAATPDDLGYFADRAGEDLLVDDLHALTQKMRADYPDKPLILVGHSMGSFLARLYAYRYGADIDALVLLGTGGPNPALPAGRLITFLLTKLRGTRYRSSFVRNLAFSGYTSRLGEGARPTAWVTSDEEVLDKYDADPLCNYTFTLSAYAALFRMVARTNCRDWVTHIRHDLPILIASGEMDPVGAYGKGPRTVADGLTGEHVEDVTLTVYPQMRHELHNEKDKATFFADLVAWLDAHVGA